MDQYFKEHNNNVLSFQHYSKAYEYFITDKLDEALQEIDLALNLNLQFSEAFILRSQIFEKIQQYDNALQDADCSIRMNNNLAELYNQSGVTLFQYLGTLFAEAPNLNNGLFEEIVLKGKELEEVIEIETIKYNFDVHRDRTFALILNPQFAQHNALDSGIQQKRLLYDKPLSSNITTYNLEESQLRLNQNMIEGYVKIHQNMAESYFQRATILWRQHKFYNALQDCLKSILMDKNFAMSYCRIGQIMYDLNLKDKALLYFTKAIEVDSNLNEAYTFRSLCIEQNDANSAIQSSQSSLSQSHNVQDLNNQNQFISNIEQATTQQQIIFDEALSHIWQEVELLQNRLQQVQKENIELKQAQIKEKEELINMIFLEDRKQIEKSLQVLNKPENYYQKIYYLSLFWRVYNYLLAIQQISNDILSINTNAIIEINSENIQNILQTISNKGLVALSPISFVQDNFRIMNDALDYAIDGKNENRFNQRVRVLKEIVKQFAPIPQKLEIEVQLAAIYFGKSQKSNKKVREKTPLSQKVDELLEKEDNTLQLQKDIYWICGTEGALKVLSYLEKNQQKILKEKQKQLSEIIKDAFNTDSELCQLI
ncbi:unnamed protein product [Paramecium octaurelia]|uniref:Tetratricopeptide repeat protein n=1 Tax=Paramecium octaurelia TaxID=43137 RepID=A0A8S1T431_PAROT|nr:unnamed protein product [Paramecium octaurelia]